MTTSVSTRSAGTLNPTRQQLDELDALLQRMLELPVNKQEETEPEAVEESIDEPPLSTANEDEELADAEWSPSQPLEDADPPSLPMGTRSAAPPVSYMVIETASPRPLPPASGFEPRPSPLTPRLVPVTPPSVESEESPVPPQDTFAETPVPSEEMTEETPAITREEEMWVPLRSTWQPSAQTWQPLAESWHQANSGLPMPECLPSPQLELPPPESDMGQAAPEIQLGPPDLSTPTIEPAPLVPAASMPESQLKLSAEDAPASVPSLLLPLLWFNQGFDACLAPLGVPGRWLCGSSGRQTLGFIGLTCLAAAVAIAASAGMGWTW